jgi:putative transcriptional regulator
MLAGYAGGSLGEGMSLLVACHLTYCACCRGAVDRLEALGGAMLAEAEPEAPPAEGLDGALARIDAPERASGDISPEVAETPLPAPLRHRMHGCGASVRWRSLMPGLAEHRIAGFIGEHVSLFRARPGVRMPAHTHTGQEGTLVLCGRLRDGPTELGPGDVGFCDESVDHRPEIVGGDTCVCLAVQTGRMQFTGPFGRLLNLLPG